MTEANSPDPVGPDEPVGDREPTSDAVEILHRRYFEGKPEMMAMLEEEMAKADDKYGRSETLQYLYDRHVGDDPERIAAYEREVARARREMEGVRAEPAKGGTDEPDGGAGG